MKSNLLVKGTNCHVCVDFCVLYFVLPLKSTYIANKILFYDTKMITFVICTLRMRVVTLYLCPTSSSPPSGSCVLLHSICHFFFFFLHIPQPSPFPSVIRVVVTVTQCLSFFSPMLEMLSLSPCPTVSILLFLFSRLHTSLFLSNLPFAPIPSTSLP